VPAQGDQPQWVVRLADDTVAVLEQERWASSLRDELREALLEELIVSHGMVDARTVPAPASPPWRIAIDVRRFDSLPGREARLEGSWTITGGAGARAASRCEWLWREPAGPGMTGLAHAHRRALSRLADPVAPPLSPAHPRETGLGQGRTVRLFCTDFTPLVFIAMFSALCFSVASLAKPESMTVPFSVSTVIAEASTVVSSTIFALTLEVIEASST
jgi:uncharacterized lipoprotein YmbA